MDSSVLVIYLLDLRVGYRPRCAQARFVEQTLQALHPKSLPPFADRSSGDLQAVRHLAVAQSLSAPKHNAGTHRDRLRGLRATRQHRQFLFLLRVTLSGLVGRPMAIPKYASAPVLFNVFLTQDTSGTRWRNYCPTASSADTVPFPKPHGFLGLRGALLYALLKSHPSVHRQSGASHSIRHCKVKDLFQESGLGGRAYGTPESLLNDCFGVKSIIDNKDYAFILRMLKVACARYAFSSP